MTTHKKIVFGRKVSGRELLFLGFQIVFSVALILIAQEMKVAAAGAILFLVALLIVRYNTRNKLVIVGDIVFIPGVALIDTIDLTKAPYDNDLVSWDGKPYSATIYFHTNNISSVAEIDTSTINVPFWRMLGFLEGRPKTVLKISFKQAVPRLMPPENTLLRKASDLMWSGKWYFAEMTEICVSLKNLDTAKGLLSSRIVS